MKSIIPYIREREKTLNELNQERFKTDNHIAKIQYVLIQDKTIEKYKDQLYMQRYYYPTDQPKIDEYEEKIYNAEKQVVDDYFKYFFDI